MHLGFQPHAAHPDRLANTLLSVDDEVLWQDVQHALIVGDGLCLGRIKNALDIALTHFFPVTNRDHAVRIHAVDVGTGNACVNRSDPALGSQFRLFDRTLDRLDGGLDIGNHTLA